MAVLLTSTLPKKVAELADTLEGDEKTGAQIILKALEAPLFHICCQCRSGRLCYHQQSQESLSRDIGFDAYNEDVCRYGCRQEFWIRPRLQEALCRMQQVWHLLCLQQSLLYQHIKEDTPAMPAGGAGNGHDVIQISYN